MEVDSVENTEISTFSSSDADHHLENLIPHISNHGDVEPKRDITEEVRCILEVSAFTGKYWHDWDMLKNLLSFRLKQVLAEYPESQMVRDVGPQQNPLFLETYPELVKRLDEALLGFVDGPPFTLQRLCEILLTPHTIYPNLSKLALALEKNLLVTSTLPICTEPYPSLLMYKPAEHDERCEDPKTHSKPIQNGIETSLRDDDDEEMTDAETDEDNNTEEAKEEKSKTSETETDPKPDPEPSSAPKPNPEPSTAPNSSAEHDSTSL